MLMSDFLRMEDNENESKDTSERMLSKHLSYGVCLQKHLDVSGSKNLLLFTVDVTSISG